MQGIIAIVTDPFVRQKFFAESEICQDNVTVRVEQDVLQFDVPVNDAQLSGWDKSHYIH